MAETKRTTTRVWYENPSPIYELSRGRFGKIESVTFIPQEGWSINLFTQSTLEEGLDLREISTRNWSLLCTVPIGLGSQVLPYVYEEIRKLALLTESDYYTHESFGSGFAKSLGNKVQEEIYQVIPRLFRKIMNN